MWLDGWSDNDPPILAGSGRIVLNGSSSTRIEIDAVAADVKEAVRALRRCAEELDDDKSAMRLRAVDYSGREWNGGWVRPRLGEIQGDHLQLRGEALSISTTGEHSTAVNSVELAYSPSPTVPFTLAMTSSARIGAEELGWFREAR